MSEVLKDYFYTGISFSSFYMDEGVFLCLKIEKSKLIFKKWSYILKLRGFLKSQKDYDECLKGNERYLVYQNVSALKNSSVVFSKNKKYIRLYRKLKKDKDALYTSGFKIDDMTVESFDNPLTIVLKEKGNENNYQELISKGKDVRFVYLDSIKEETGRDIIFDAIKVKLLQDETEYYFIEGGIFANYIANFIFSLNKIAIII